MADIMLHTTSANSITCVSNVFIDDFMKDANGEYVKIYLYLLRCLGRDDFEFSISEVADRLDHTEKDVMRALTYWEKVGLLHLEYSEDNELSGICLNDVAGHTATVSPVVSKPLVHEPVVQKAPKAPSKPNYSADQLLAFSSEEPVKDLFFAVNSYLGRPVSNAESSSVLFWYDVLGFSIELIEYLIESSIDNGHNSFHYMDKVALNWKEEGITTVEQAKSKSKAFSGTNFSIMKAMGITNMAVIQYKQELIDKWVKDFHFSDEIICEACKRSVLATNKPSFEYADSIMESWHKSGVKTLEDITKLDESFVNATAAKVSAKKATTRKKTVTSDWTHNFDQRDNDDELERLERSLLAN